MRSVKRFVSLMLALCLMLGCAVAEGPSTPTDIAPEATEEPASPPTEAPAEEPTEELTEEPTAEPTQELTEEPTLEPAEEPTQAPVEAPTKEPTAEPAPWDESLCGHNTVNCERAPECDIPGCTHIIQDAHGLDIPACALGEWLLDAQEGSSIMTLSVRANVIDLNVADATIYRSGTYTVKGGNLRPGASVTVTKNRVVVLELENVTLGALTAEKGSLIFFQTKGQNALDTLNALGDNEITFTQGGAMTIGTVKAAKTQKPDEITFEVQGGSLRADLTEKNGLSCYSFPASGATRVNVAGKAYAAIPHEDGVFYLWLEAPDAGMKWTAEAQDAMLMISQTADLPQEGSQGVRQGENNLLQANTAYALSGEVAAGTLLTIDQSGVTVVLDGVTAADTLITANSAYTLHITGENTIGSLTGGGKVTLQGDGKLTVTGTLPINAAFLSGRYVLANVPTGFTACAVGIALSDQSVTLDGADYPLMMSADGSLLLPAPGQDKTYAITADGETVTVRTVDAGELAFTLTQAAPVADAGSAQAFTVTGDGSFVTGGIAAFGATANATFQNVRLQGDGTLLTLSGEHLTVTLMGDNTLQSASGAAITMTADSTLALNAASGRLALRGQNDLTGITLQGNILVEPAPDRQHTSLIIRDKSGNPVPNKELTVSIGGQTWRYTTHYDGSLHLWGLGDISGQDVAATDGENVYTAVVVNGQAQMTTGLTDFSKVTFSSQSDGSLLMSWAVPGAGTTGVQLLYGSKAYDMPDTYVAGARHIPGNDFSARVTGIPAGSVVTVRVYATQAVGAVFSEETADGFQFGEIYTYVHRAPWQYEGEAGDADAVYTGKAYRNPVKVPEGATVTYKGSHLVNGMPVYPGDYVMVVTIPENDPTYQPGTVEIPFTIEKIVVTITPGYNLQKYKYRADPEFSWTAKGLLDGDTVTGVLTREEGEEVGEYAWRVDGFHAADYYELRIDPNAEPFLILPLAPLGGILVDEIMHPVEQTIVLKDGRKLIVTLTAQESLTVTHSVLGNLVRNEADEPRLFTPQLSWNPETDEVLLMMRAEPELSIDHGYQTDSMGNPIWGVRRIRLSGNGLMHMDSMGITALTLVNKQASLTCRVEDFLTEEIAALIKEAKGELATTVFWLTVEPVKDVPDDIRPVTDGWRMSAVMKVEGQEIDITSLLPNLTAAVDMEPLAALLNEMDRYDEETFPEQFMLSLGDGTALETTFVEPFEEEELEKAGFPSMMYIDRYAFAPLTASGTVYAVNAPAKEEAAEENVAASAK